MMNPEEIRSKAEAIWKMRNPTHIKTKDFRYADPLFKDRVEKIDRLAADKADAKELEEVYE